MRCISSHPVVIVLCTKLDAECDQQATVVSQLLTTNGDDRHVVTKLFLVQKLGKRKLRLFSEIFEFHICLINILQLQGALSPRPEAFGSDGCTTTNPMHWLKVRHMQ